MDFLKVIILSVSSLVVIFILIKLMGNKQISQINMFDYVTGITIGSIAAEMATGLDKNPFFAIAAMCVYTLISIIISMLTTKSVKIQKILAGRPIILMDNNVIYRSNLKKARMDSSDFLMMCRAQGYFNLSQIQTAVLEFNGNLSILPKSEYKALTPQDMGMSPEQEYLVAVVVQDGKILRENLSISNLNEKWLLKHLNQQGYKDEKDVFLATCNVKNELTVYPMVKKKLAVDIFE